MKALKILLTGGTGYIAKRLLPVLLEDGRLLQSATFRPLGLWGRFYWYALLPLHLVIFDGMARRLAE